MCTLSVSNVIYHKFSHGTAFYTLNGKNVNVMLESLLIHGFWPVNARLLIAYGTGFYAINEYYNLIRSECLYCTVAF